VTPHQAKLTVADEVGKCYADPLEFVRLAYPWGESGTILEHHRGPDDWQRDILVDIGKEVRARNFDGVHTVLPVRFAVASGHGIGKSALVAWIVDWIMSTRAHAQGTITANTFTQLQTKTWAQIQKWTALCITADWFRLTGDRMYHREHPSTWFCSAQTSRDENSEGFAGQHALTSTSFYLNDEDSAVSDLIHEVEEGGLTDGEPMIFLFGNPTRNTGKFHDVTFGKDRPTWNHRSIDSRSSSFSNKELIAQWARDYGEDSDFFRVRVKGLPPNASELQYIGLDRVQKAQTNEPLSLDDDPLICGVDISGGGAAWNVVRFRRGFDSRSIPPIRLSGAKGDRQVMIAKLAEVLSVTREEDPARYVSMMFIDSAFGAPIVERLQMLGYGDRVAEINFGGKAPDEAHFANMRAYMWTQTKEWLPRGAIDPLDEQLEVDLTGPGFHFNRTNQLVLESKAEMQKRGVSSPDDGDALVLTFAQPVAPIVEPAPRKQPPNMQYTPYG
jgi:hypothetical protein